MRTWRRLVAFLCFVYLSALYLFHHQLVPATDSSNLPVDDYMDNHPQAGAGEKPGGESLAARAAAARSSFPTALNASHLEHFTVHHAGGERFSILQHLQHLEAGMTQLEEEISDVRAKLVVHARARAAASHKDPDGSAVIVDETQTGDRDVARQPDPAPVDFRQREAEKDPLKFVTQIAQSAAGWNEDFAAQHQDLGAADRGRVVHVNQPEDAAAWRQYQDMLRRLRQDLLQTKLSGQWTLQAAEKFPIWPQVVRPWGSQKQVLMSSGGDKSMPPFIVSSPGPPEDFNNTSLTKIGPGVAFYSAFHDDRLVNESYVRLVLIVNEDRPQKALLCHFAAAGIASPNSAFAQPYELCENHKKKYLGFIYSCPVPPWAADRAYNLSLSVPGSADSKMAVAVPVLYVTPDDVREGKVREERYQYKYNFSVCVSPLFGSVLAKRLVEFLELLRLLGVQQVFFYDFHVSDTVQRVLYHYRDKGWVTVLPWKLPTTMDTNTIWYRGQLVTNNDCLYRTMPLSRYTAFHDIDELIVPRSLHARTLQDLFPNESLPNDTCGYAFQSVFFDPSVSGHHFLDDLMTVSLTTRPNQLSKIRTKVLVQPRRVFEVGIHHISKQLLEHWAPHAFDPSQALLHHYRECIRDFGMRCADWVQDAIVRDHFMPVLHERFQSTVRALTLL